MSNLNAQQQKNMDAENQAAIQASAEAARKWREKQAKKALVNQEPPPLVRLRAANRDAIYPKMVPDGKGGWKMADPKAVGDFLATRDTLLSKSK